MKTIFSAPTGRVWPYKILEDDDGVFYEQSGGQPLVRIEDGDHQIASVPRFAKLLVDAGVEVETVNRIVKQLCA